MADTTTTTPETGPTGLTGTQIANGLIALGFVGILGIMLGYVPPTLLSFLLVINITFSLLILLISLYITAPLEFSTFPTVLLVITFYRLSLNVASTKLILQADTGTAGLQKAGPVIAFFGQIVAGNSPVIGFVVFAILVLIQFIVITKGATRVAEVAARFTLDAMPGKQMAIDADLNAGLVSESEARSRRATIAQEADFYGAMDGASKFVRGDAIASIIITVINIIGGFVVGMTQSGLTVLGVLEKYTILTIGDGLVSQIPSLMISIAAGIVVTRASGDATLGSNLVRQFFGRTEALFLGAAALLMVAVLGAFVAPGVIMPFSTVGVALGITAYFMQRSIKESDEEAERVREEEEEVPEGPEQVERLLEVDPMEIEIGYALIPCVDTSQGGDLLDRVSVIRRQTALELGLIVPPIRIRDNMQLSPRAYNVLIRGTRIADGELRPDRLLAMHPEGEPTAEEDIPGIRTSEPAFGLPAKWIEPSERSRAEMAGYTIVEPSSVLATHLTEIVKNNADLLLGRKEVRELVDHLRERNEALVGELLDQIGVKIGTLQKILQNLVRERVSIRNLEPIFETIADNAEAVQQNPDALTEYCRMGLARTITQMYVDEENRLSVLTLDPQIEAKILDAIQRSAGAGLFATDPAYAEQVLANVRAEADKQIAQGRHPIILTTPQLRAHVRRMMERRVPGIIVLSYSEVSPDVQVNRLGTIQAEAAA